MVADGSNCDGKSSGNPREGPPFCFALALQVRVEHPGDNVQCQVDKVWRRCPFGNCRLASGS